MDAAHASITRRKLLAWAAASAPAAAALAGASTAWAGPAGDAVLLNYPGWMGPSEIKGFSKRFPGAKVTQSTEVPDSGSYIQFVKSRPGAFDFVLADKVSVEQAKAAGVFQATDFSKVPNIAKIAPKYRKDFPFAVPNDTGKVVIGYRGDLVGGRISSWADFWRLCPKLDGKVTVLDIDGDTIGAALKYLGKSVDKATPDDYEKAKDALVKIKPHLQAVTSKDLGKKLASGQIAMCICFDYDIALAQSKSKKVKWALPAEGTTGYIEGFMPIRGTGKLDVIQAFLNFHLEPKNYADFVNFTGSSWLMPAAERYIKPALRDNPVLAPSAAVLKRVEFSGLRSEVGQAAFVKAWEEFKAA